jgi:hypothetical protein
MPPAQSLQIQLFGFSAFANGEAAIYSLALVALAFIILQALRRR